MTHVIRTYESPTDAQRQYDLWLAATESLPRAWRSCLRNVEFQLKNAENYPGCRLYAERDDGSFAGYIGTHPPFEWIIEDHGPPARSLGWAIPFGFPWTNPRDEALAEDLYRRMCESIPVMYAESQRDIYIQRFRESWTWVTDWLVAHGWKLHDRLPLMGRPVGSPKSSTDLRLVERDELPWLAEVAGRDPTHGDVQLESIERSYDGGWLVHDGCWKAGELGAFAIESRGAHAAITFLCAEQEHWDDVLESAAAKAGSMGAGEIYFTVDAERDRPLLEALTDRGFGEVDAGVYYLRDAD